MSEIINIQYDSRLLETRIHLENLTIASSNLSEFNHRNPEKDDIEFEYLEVNGKFILRRISDSPYPHYSERYLPLGWFITMLRNKQWHSHWVKYYPERMYSYFLEFYSLYGASEIDLFVKLFKDFVPLGDFLSTEHQDLIRNNFNEHCRIAQSYR
ncbi:hypothetical protein [Flagellimonas nanhaiensis]|uniref:Uncharacterized protein n=1 Tax=Flagellimonas nanhaiensis TaxID=2292706 RepID=A0A371JRS5_9FLAO|nr:hypothetical protein [Allomuricauda nanhaiensis]RDY60211.1 hypothetical protein DX873_12865 [Allomuricauda nanhaiensis]